MMPLRMPSNTDNYAIISNSTATNDSTEATRLYIDKPFAVPFCDQPSGSGWVSETLYRAFEILIAAFVLIITLPLIAISALLIRLDSPGPAFFFHCRPARSTLVRGRDLLHRTD